MNSLLVDCSASLGDACLRKALLKRRQLLGVWFTGYLSTHETAKPTLRLCNEL